MTSTTKLEQLLDELVRPALRAHGGDAELVSFQDGMSCHISPLIYANVR